MSQGLNIATKRLCKIQVFYTYGSTDVTFNNVLGHTDNNFTLQITGISISKHVTFLGIKRKETWRNFPNTEMFI